MRNKEQLKQAICEAVDRRREKIESIGDQIMAHPELGFKEFKTAQLVSDTMKSLDIPHETGLAITGVKGVIKGKKPGPGVLRFPRLSFSACQRVNPPKQMSTIELPLSDVFMDSYFLNFARVGGFHMQGT